MKKIIYQKKLIIIIAIILVSSFLIFLENKSNLELEDFKILNVEEVDGKLTVICQNSTNASKYQVTITDEDENVLLSESNSSNRIDISQLRIAYNQEVYINAIAQNQELSKKSSNTYKYISKEPTISENTSHIITSDNDVYINILGDIKQEKYTLRLKHQNITLYETIINDNSIKIAYDYLKGYDGRLTAYIINSDNYIVNEFNIYNNPILVGNIYITSPSNNLSINWDDLTVTYQGGDNATKYLLKIYNGKKYIASFEGTNNQVTIPAKTFKTNTSYTLELLAMYNDYEEIAKKTTIDIFIKNQLEVKPVTVDYNYNYLRSGTKLTLATQTKGATIKYTTNGKDPLKYGIVYQNPIIITENMTLKTVAIKKNQKNSAINTYKLKVGYKTPVVYLSPSNQYLNFGVSSVGYTNEREQMNKVADYIEQKLKESGIIVYRNNPQDDMSKWLSESRNVKSDLHFAIHSNASANHNTKGMEIFVDDKTSPALSIATKIYRNLYAIYPNKDATTDRGVRYAQGSLGEVKEINIKNGVLIEIAFHDYEEDARWLVDKQKEIGYNIANSIIDYFQMN